MRRFLWRWKKLKSDYQKVTNYVRDEELEVNTGGETKITRVFDNEFGYDNTTRVNSGSNVNAASGPGSQEENPIKVFLQSNGFLQNVDDITKDTEYLFYLLEGKLKFEVYKGNASFLAAAQTSSCNTNDILSNLNQSQEKFFDLIKTML